MLDILTKLIRLCIVASIDYKNSSVRVEFPERGVISGDLHVLQRRSKGNLDYDMPEVGEEVLCLFIPHNNFIEGYVIGSSYNDEDLPSEDIGKGIKSYRWSDGTYIKYNENNKKMEISCIGDISITSGNLVSLNAKDLQIDVENNISFNAGGNFTASAGLMELTSNGNLDIEASQFGVSASESNFDHEINAADIVTDKGSHNKHDHLDSLGKPTTPPQ